MKRSPMPPRKKPLTAKKGLDRGGPLRRQALPSPGSGPETPDEGSAGRRRKMRGQGNGLRQTGLAPIPPEVVAEVQARSGGRCEVRWDRRCAGEGQHRHHRAGRGKGRDRADLIVDSCLRCHHEVHAHPERSYAEGWMISRVAPLPPAPAPQPPFATRVG